jgi:hypothetical protein
VHGGLETAMAAWQRAAVALETRVLAPARRLGELGVATGAPIEALPGGVTLGFTSEREASSSTGTSR